MMMALGGLFRANLIEWITSMTYQAASGAGAQNMRELVEQMGSVHDVGRRAAATTRRARSSTSIASSPSGCVRPGCRNRILARLWPAACIPWIDKDMGNGLSREEWKGGAETNKILGRTETTAIPVEGICVRVGAMRCHSQAMTIKLKRDLPLVEIERLVAGGNDWVRLVPNTREASIASLTPAAVSGRLEIPIGRLRKLAIGGDYITAFTVGDQLLWGAAEPIRRMLRILVERGQG